MTGLMLTYFPSKDLLKRSPRRDRKRFFVYVPIKRLHSVGLEFRLLRITCDPAVEVEDCFHSHRVYRCKIQPGQLPWNSSGLDRVG